MAISSGLVSDNHPEYTEVRYMLRHLRTTGPNELSIRDPAVIPQMMGTSGLAKGPST